MEPALKPQFCYVLYLLLFKRTRPSASVVLPSYLKRRIMDRRSGANQPKKMKAASLQCWDRDIIIMFASLVCHKFKQHLAFSTREESFDSWEAGADRETSSNISDVSG